MFLGAFSLRTNQQQPENDKDTYQQNEIRPTRFGLAGSGGLRESFTNQHAIPPETMNKNSYINMTQAYA
jgi:hypothetical protein